MVARQADRLSHELGAVAVRCLRVGPVEEENGGTATTRDRLHQEPLGVISEPDVTDASAVTLPGDGTIVHGCLLAL